MSTSTSATKGDPAEKEPGESERQMIGPTRKRYLDFEPIKIKGEPLSVTILRDRGPY